ncbi:HTH DNA binding domain-containing protein [Haladaptatus litoreus]|uniref:HTH DNA binding domain-containing protein n=1 Tax=Haladaptatus litoreus TaxID=553468 RepID=A0A1N6VX05_9EURY|nr:helix-turn-helix domain-containing protein [Haladaptatus litoreus]SIQ82268.1 HTH DNA binding domain-containing protein [Haladaptatus litoreus]
MPRVRLKVGPMPDMKAVAEQFPDTIIRFLANYPTDEGVCSVLEIRTDDPERFVRDALEQWDMGTVEVLHTDDSTVVVTTEGQPPEGYFVSEDIEYHPTTPVVARDGYLFIEFVMPESKMAAMWKSLDERNVEYHVQSITDGYDVTDSLTARQREILTVAIERGYYDNPRTCSLTTLAEELDVNKSVISGVLHRAEGEIIKDALGDPRENKMTETQ